MYWRFVVVAIMTGTSIVLQSIQLNIGQVFADNFHETKSSDLSVLSNVSKNDGVLKNYLTTYSRSQQSYFIPFILQLVNLWFSTSYWKVRTSSLFLMCWTILLTGFTLFNLLRYYWLTMVVRACQGSFTASAGSIIFDYLSIWIPPKERGTVCGFVYGSTAFAVALSSWFTGGIYQSLGWKYVFYIGPPISLVVVIPLLFTTSPPDLHPFVSEEEINYISNEFKGTADKDQQRPSIKLRNVFSWKPFLAAVFAFSCFTWSWFMVLYILPLYLEQICGFNILANFHLAALPFLCAWFVSIISGIVLDVLAAYEMLKLTNARKICILISCVIPCVCFLVLNVVEKIPAICVIWAMIMAMGVGLTGIYSALMDIAPNFGFLIMMLASSLLSFIYIPIVVIIHLLDFTSPWAFWLICAITSGLLVIEAIVFVLFFSSDEAGWNKPEQE